MRTTTRTAPTYEQITIGRARVTALSRSEIDDRLSAAAFWWVVTSSTDDGPHAVPVWGVVVDGRLCTYADPHARRVRDLADDDRGVLHLESASDVLIVRGRFRTHGPVVDDPEVVAAYAAKYPTPADADFLPGAPGMAGIVLVTFEPASALAWSLDDFFASQRRWSA
jgi:Pyridoxamine 5'-phosphate oxidase